MNNFDKPQVEIKLTHEQVLKYSDHFTKSYTILLNELIPKLKKFDLKEYDVKSKIIIPNESDAINNIIHRLLENSELVASWLRHHTISKKIFIKVLLMSLSKPLLTSLNILHDMIVFDIPTWDAVELTNRYLTTPDMSFSMTRIEQEMRIHNQKMSKTSTVGMIGILDTIFGHFQDCKNVSDVKHVINTNSELRSLFSKFNYNSHKSYSSTKNKYDWKNDNTSAYLNEMLKYVVSIHMITARNLSSLSGIKTISSRAIMCSTKLLLPNDIGKHCVSNLTRLITKYVCQKPP